MPPASNPRPHVPCRTGQPASGATAPSNDPPGGQTPPDRPSGPCGPIRPRRDGSPGLTSLHPTPDRRTVPRFVGGNVLIISIYGDCRHALVTDYAPLAVPVVCGRMRAAGTIINRRKELHLSQPRAHPPAMTRPVRGARPTYEVAPMHE